MKSELAEPPIPNPNETPSLLYISKYLRPFKPRIFTLRRLPGASNLAWRGMTIHHHTFSYVQSAIFQLHPFAPLSSFQ